MKIYDELVWRGLIKDVSSPEIEEKLKYIGLSLDNISPNLQEEQPLNYRVPRDYDENQYKQYRYIPVSKISILLTPTNRLDELEEKYRKATPLIAFLDNQSEESSIRHSIFLNMLKQLSLEDLEKLEKEQQKLSKNVPFRVKYENNSKSCIRTFAEICRKHS